VIPVGDSPRSGRVPWVNYAIILANVAVFVFMLGLSTGIAGTNRQALQDFQDQTSGVCYGFETRPSDADRFICTWSFQPGEFFDTLSGEPGLPGGPGWQAIVSIVTAMFLHGGWLHIIGNMLFLWVFGDNVEDRMGHLGYLVFFLAAGIAAALLQGVMDPNSVVPVLGASGAVAGVLGAYIVWYPNATVNVVIPFFILIFIPIPIPAFIMIGLWFLQNLLSGYATISEAAGATGGVAWFAHIGGFVFGALLVALFLRNHGRRRAPPAW
jgi:membrane associated rhomboid family serine protease